MIPNDAQFYQAILLTIATNPALTEAEVYDPISIVRGSPELVKIKKYKLYGGLELLEQGLTLAVYPAHSDYNHKSSIINQTPKNKSTEVYCGDGSYVEYHDIYRIIIQLSYLDPNFDYEKDFSLTLKEYYSNSMVPLWAQRLTIHPEDGLDNRYASPTQDYFGREGVNKILNLPISIMPGEEIIRQYVYQVKLALSSIRHIQPYSIKTPSLKWVDYPTTSPLRQSGDNLIFHTALMCVEFDVFNQPDARPKRLIQNY